MQEMPNTQIKKLERQRLDEKVAAFLASGRTITVLPRDASAKPVEKIGEELKAVLDPPKRTRAEAQAELAKRHFKAGKDQRRRAENETKPGETPKRKRSPRQPKGGV